MRQLNSAASKAAMGPMPLVPFLMASQVASVPVPTADSSPTPVTTTLRCKFRNSVVLGGNAQYPYRARGVRRETVPDPSGVRAAPCAPRNLFLLRLDVVDGVLHGDDLFGVLVGNIEVERFLERHHQLDDIERVGSEVIDETGSGVDLGLIHTQLLDDDLFDLLLNGHAPSRILPTNSLILPMNDRMPQVSRKVPKTWKVRAGKGTCI